MMEIGCPRHGDPDCQRCYLPVDEPERLPPLLLMGDPLPEAEDFRPLPDPRVHELEGVVQKLAGEVWELQAERDRLNLHLNATHAVLSRAYRAATGRTGLGESRGIVEDCEDVRDELNRYRAALERIERVAGGTDATPTGAHRWDSVGFHRYIADFQRVVTRMAREALAPVTEPRP